MNLQENKKIKIKSYVFVYAIFVRSNHCLKKRSNALYQQKKTKKKKPNRKQKKNVDFFIWVSAFIFLFLCCIARLFFKIQNKTVKKKIIRCNVHIYIFFCCSSWFFLRLFFFQCCSNVFESFIHIFFIGFQVLSPPSLFSYFALFICVNFSFFCVFLCVLLVERTNATLENNIFFIFQKYTTKCNVICT